MARTFICGYYSHLDELAAYSDEQVGRLYRAMLTFAKDGIDPEFEPGAPESFIWPSLRGQIVRDIAAYKRSCALKKGAVIRRWSGDASASAAPEESFEDYRNRLLTSMTGE